MQFNRNSTEGWPVFMLIRIDLTYDISEHPSISDKNLAYRFHINPLKRDIKLLGGMIMDEASHEVVLAWDTLNTSLNAILEYFFRITNSIRQRKLSAFESRILLYPQVTAAMVLSYSSKSDFQFNTIRSNLCKILHLSDARNYYFLVCSNIIKKVKSY